MGDSEQAATNRMCAALQSLGAVEPRTRMFADYWNSLPKTDLVPSRSAFKPEENTAILANIVIHELISPEHIRLRLVGSAVIEEYGREITGRNYLDFVDEERRPKASRAIFLVCEQPCGMYVLLRSQGRSGRVMTRESIAFPMRDDEGVARLVYFCSSPARERTDVFEDPDELRIMNVLRRTFIDIGAGIPDFRD